MSGLNADALDALEFGWGEAYELGMDEFGYWARRRDGLGGKLAADDPEQLREQVIADYTLKPVPRDVFPPDPTTVQGTTRTGIIPGTGGDVDHVVCQQVWQAAHPGGSISREVPGQLGYIARWPDGSLAATAYASLATLMERLNQAETEGRCPVHGKQA